MSYDLQTPADLLALFQGFLAAHPHHRAATEAMREVAQMPGDYFASLPMVEEMAAWARKRHLMTRRSAQELVARAARFHYGPGHRGPGYAVSGHRGAAADR
jgi:hypothetical protein